MTVLLGCPSDPRCALAQIYAWLSAHGAITAAERIRAESRCIDQNPDAGTCLAGTAVILGAITEASDAESLVQLLCQTLFDVLYTLGPSTRHGWTEACGPTLQTCKNM